MMTSTVAPATFFDDAVRKYDPITFAGHMADFEHLWQDTLDVEIDMLGIPFKRPCSEEEIHRPTQSSAISPFLHKTSTYEVGLDGLKDTLHEEYLFSHFANIVYSNDPAAVAESVLALGWNTVGMATTDVNEEDPVYLFQNPDDLSCALVFRGTDDVSDSLSDVGCSQVDFCGFADPTDFTAEGQFEPIDGHVLVHEGFRDELRRSISSDGYKKHVFPKLSSCEGVYLVGHSLGAAEATYFTACASRELQEGDYGYDDYRLIAWKDGSKKKMKQLHLGKPGEKPADGGKPCELNTGGTCHFAACNSARGLLVECVNGNCVCQDGSCSVAGYCVPITPLFAQ